MLSFEPYALQYISTPSNRPIVDDSMCVSSIIALRSPHLLVPILLLYHSLIVGLSKQSLQLQPWGRLPLQAETRLQRRATLGSQLIFTERADISADHVSTHPFPFRKKKQTNKQRTLIFLSLQISLFHAFNFMWFFFSLYRLLRIS